MEVCVLLGLTTQLRQYPKGKETTKLDSAGAQSIVQSEINSRFGSWNNSNLSTAFNSKVDTTVANANYASVAALAQTNANFNNYVSLTDAANTYYSKSYADANFATLNALNSYNTSFTNLLGGKVSQATYDQFVTTQSGINTSTATSIEQLKVKIETSPNLMPFPSPKSLSETPTSYGWKAVNWNNVAAPFIYASSATSHWKIPFYYNDRYQANAGLQETALIFDIENQPAIYPGSIAVSCANYWSFNADDLVRVGVQIVDLSGTVVAESASGFQTLTRAHPHSQPRAEHIFEFLNIPNGSIAAGQYKIRLTFAVKFGSTTAAVYQYFYVNQIKVEFGNKATAFSNEGTVTNIQKAVLDAEGKIALTWGFALDANGKVVGIKAMNDGATGTLDIVFDKLRINGAQVFEVDGSNVRIGSAFIKAATIRDLQVPAASNDTKTWRVALRPEKYYGTDSQTISIGGGTSNPVNIEWDGKGAPPLAAGQSFEFKAVNYNQSAGTFQVSAKIFTAGATVVKSTGAGTNVGGTPQWRANKPDNTDADNNIYIFRVKMQIPKTMQEPLGGGFFNAIYEGGFTPNNFDGANQAITLAPQIVSFDDNYESDPPSSVTIEQDFAIQIPPFGGAGTYDFGVHPLSGTTILEFGNATNPAVKYNYTSQSNQSTFGGLVGFNVTPNY